MSKKRKFTARELGIEDDTFYEAFTRARPTSLGELEDYAKDRFGRSGSTISLDDYEDSGSSDDDQHGTHDRKFSHNSGHHQHGATTNKAKEKKVREDLVPKPHPKGEKSEGSGSSKARSRLIHRKAQASHHFFSGIIHSDMDVQRLRPPLMYQMNVIEWLWLQSTATQRIAVLMVGFLLTVIIFHFGLAMTWFYQKGRIQNPYLCNTESCRYLGTRIRKTLNRAVGPCDDFYAFVCGSSGVNHQLNPTAARQWNYGFDEGRINYDFDYSKSLGNMLKPTDTFPDNLVLTMYKACLEHPERNAKGMRPYYDFLKESKLYSISKDVQISGSDVIESMARILSHFFVQSAIVSVKYYVDEDDGRIKTYIEPSTILPEVLRGGSVHRHGYRLYHDTIRKALLLVKDELKISDEEMNILPHDILCMDLYLRDFKFADDADNLKYMNDNFGDQNFTHNGCDLGRKHQDVVLANFGNKAIGSFDWKRLILRLKELGEGTSGPILDMDSNPTTNERSAVWFVKELEEVWKRSAPIRLMRYLQWRVLYDFSFLLDEEIFFVMIHIRRYAYSGYMPSCFHNLFEYLPFIAPNRFFQQIPEERLNKIEEQFEDLMKRLSGVYAAMTIHSTFHQVETLVNVKFSEKQKLLFQNMILYHYSQSTEIPPVLFKAANFPNYPDLYKGIHLSEFNHVANILKMGRRMHQWRINDAFIMDFWGIAPAYHQRILLNMLSTDYDASTNTLKTYIPIGSIESPFFHDGLAVSDASGLGLIIGQAKERSFVQLLYEPDGLKALIKHFVRKGYTRAEITTMRSYLDTYVDALKNDIKNSLCDWETEGFKWCNINNTAAMNHILDTLLMDEGRYEATATMVDLYLNNPANKRESKLVLKDLEEFNAKKLYYIILVNRMCEPLGKNKFAHISKFGPLSQEMLNNIQLSYQDDFAKTFECPLNSKMNPKNKVYFQDRNTSIAGEDHPKLLRM